MIKCADYFVLKMKRLTDEISDAHALAEKHLWLTGALAEPPT